MMPDSPNKILLNHTLPPDMVAGLTCWPLRYRRYPVFSWPWWRGRFLTSFGCILAYALVGVLGSWVVGKTVPQIVITWSYFVVGGLLMVNLGPALSTWLRVSSALALPRRWMMIVLAFLGFVIAAAADYWASSGIQKASGETEVPKSERKISEHDEAAIKLAGLGAFFIYFALGGGLATLAYFSEQRRFSARSVLLQQLGTTMRLNVLQAQIEPHFLFNTLAAIRPLLKQDPARAETALDALADHLRAVLPNSVRKNDTMDSTLGAQLDICTSYLELMKLRMGNRLEVSLAVDDELRSHAFPPMMLVSLVENAIKHGLEPKPGAGSLRITASQGDDKLRVQVEDDGVGLSGGLSGGVGLANIREQLHLRFGEKAALEVASRRHGGTLASISLPIQTPPA
jgi:signal transduction histidine kinase